MDQIRGKAFGRLVFGTMVVVAAAHVLSSYRQVSQAGEQYGRVVLGQSVDELTRILARPQSVVGQGNGHRYLHDGRVLQVTFDPASRTITGVSCREQELTATACPKHLGIALGSSRGEVLNALGPDSGSNAPGASALTFPAIGTRIELANDVVSAISLSNTPDRSSPWPLVVWRILP